MSRPGCPRRVGVGEGLTWGPPAPPPLNNYWDLKKKKIGDWGGGWGGSDSQNFGIFPNKKSPSRSQSFSFIPSYSHSQSQLFPVIPVPIPSHSCSHSQSHSQSFPVNPIPNPSYPHLFPVIPSYSQFHSQLFLLLFPIYFQLFPVNPVHSYSRILKWKFWGFFKTRNFLWVFNPKF